MILLMLACNDPETSKPEAFSSCEVGPSSLLFEAPRNLSRPDLARFDNGWLAVFEDTPPSLDATDIQVVVPGEKPQRVNVEDAVAQQPSVQPAADGGFHVTWRQDGQIRARMLDAQGAPIGDVEVLVDGPAEIVDHRLFTQGRIAWTTDDGQSHTLDGPLDGPIQNLLAAEPDLQLIAVDSPLTNPWVLDLSADAVAVYGDEPAIDNDGMVWEEPLMYSPAASVQGGARVSVWLDDADDFEFRIAITDPDGEVLVDPMTFETADTPLVDPAIVALDDGYAVVWREVFLGQDRLRSIDVVRE